MLLFLHLAELFLKSDKHNDAHACVEEAISVSQMNHELIYLVSFSPSLVYC